MYLYDEKALNPQEKISPCRLSQNKTKNINWNVIIIKSKVQERNYLGSAVWAENLRKCFAHGYWLRQTQKKMVKKYSKPFLPRGFNVET